MDNLFEIIIVKGNTGYIKAPLLIPFYMTDSRHCILLDTGTAAMREKLVRTMEAADLIPIALPLGEAEISRTPAAVKSHLIMAHRGIAEAPFDDLIEQNYCHFQTEIEKVASLIDRQMTEEEIYKTVQTHMKISVATPEQALNMKRFLQPYLEHLLDTHIIKQSVREQVLCYEPAN